MNGNLVIGQKKEWVMYLLMEHGKKKAKAGCGKKGIGKKLRLVNGIV